MNKVEAEQNSSLETVSSPRPAPESREFYLRRAEGTAARYRSFSEVTRMNVVEIHDAPEQETEADHETA